MLPVASVDVELASDSSDAEPAEALLSFPVLAVFDDPVFDEAALDDDADDDDVLLPVGPTAAVDELVCEVDDVAVVPIPEPLPPLGPEPPVLPVFPLVPVFELVNVTAALLLVPTLVPLEAVDELESVGGPDVSAGEQALTVMPNTVAPNALPLTPKSTNFISLALPGSAPRCLEPTSRRHSRSTRAKSFDREELRGRVHTQADSSVVPAIPPIRPRIAPAKHSL